jgi:hypothetical protein
MLVATRMKSDAGLGRVQKQNLTTRSEAHRLMPAILLIVWGIIIGIWADWFIALVIISIAQSMWQSRDRWRLQTKRWWRSRS